MASRMNSNCVYLSLAYFIVLLARCGGAFGANLVCYYDALSHEREGLAKFSLKDLEVTMQYCTHIVYGYAGIKPETYEILSLRKSLDLDQRHYSIVTAFKERNPHVKFLLSVGGDHDLADGSGKYIGFLEADRQRQGNFIKTSLDYVRRFGFDGIDLAFQLPRNKPRKVHSDIGMAWKNTKKFFTGDFVVDERAHEHKQQFTQFVEDLHGAYAPYNLLITLTVLPNVNSSWYYNGPALADRIEFINLAAFDFLTPDRNPEEADYTAPIYEPPGQNRLSHYNINEQLNYWLGQRISPSKLVLGVASYGRAWKMTEDSGDSGTPVVPKTQGAAPAGPQTRIPGLLNWAEICLMLPNVHNMRAVGEHAPLRRVSDATKSYGTYAFRPADVAGEHGLWVSYDDPESAASKAVFARAKGLGGIALFDITKDDFRGQCTGDRFPIMRAIKYRLLNG